MPVGQLDMEADCRLLRGGRSRAAGQGAGEEEVVRRGCRRQGMPAVLVRACVSQAGMAAWQKGRLPLPKATMRLGSPRKQSRNGSQAATSASTADQQHQMQPKSKHQQWGAVTSTTAQLRSPTLMSSPSPSTPTLTACLTPSRLSPSFSRTTSSTWL